MLYMGFMDNKPATVKPASSNSKTRTVTVPVKHFHPPPSTTGGQIIDKSSDSGPFHGTGAAAEAPASGSKTNAAEPAVKLRVRDPTAEPCFCSNLCQATVPRLSRVLVNRVCACSWRLCRQRRTGSLR
jgi:hypothetical protein